MLDRRLRLRKHGAMTVHAKPTPTLDVPFPGELIGSRAIIQGASGAGKTYAIRRILETTHGRMQHFVLDVEDELFTLRERFDYVLIGGDGADAPVSEDTAAELAITLLELGVSAILQLNDLGLSGQRRVIAQFLAGLMKAPRPLWHPVMVTLDEAHRYAPQNAVVESSEAIVNLATAGRKRGFGALFATQRLSQLSKDVLGQCPNRILGRVDQSLDKRVAADTLGFSSSSPQAQGLMRLAHEFWVVGPAFAPEPRLIRFSPAVTTHLSAGHDNVPSPPTPEKVRALLGRLTRIASEPKPELARNSVPDRHKEASPPAADTLRNAEQRGYQRGLKEGESTARAAASHFYNAEIARIADALKRLQNGAPERDVPSASAAQFVEEEIQIAAASPRKATNAAAASPGHIPIAGAMQLLTTAVTHWPVCFTWGQLSTLNGRKARGGHFNACRKFLVESGLVIDRDSRIEPTDAAFEKTGIPRKESARTRDQLLDMWLAALPSPAKDIAAQRGAVAVEDVGAELGLATR